MTDHTDTTYEADALDLDHEAVVAADEPAAGTDEAGYKHHPDEPGAITRPDGTVVVADDYEPEQVATDEFGRSF